MTDWYNDLSNALASGDTEYMQAMLARVPKDVLEHAFPHIERLAQHSAQQGKIDEASTYYGLLIDAMPDRTEHLVERAQLLLAAQRHTDALVDAARITALAPQHAAGHRLHGEALDALGDYPQAIAAYRNALRLDTREDATRDAIQSRIQTLDTLIRKQTILEQAFNPDAAQTAEQIEVPPPEQVTFNPALFADATLPPSFDSFRVEGLRQHLWRYSCQQSPKHVISRLEDPVWLAAWDTALAAVSGVTIALCGSEFGVLGLCALQHGASHVYCVDDMPLDARIATGMVQKHFLAPWRARHGEAIRDWSEEERRASFEEIAKDIDIVAPDDPRLSEAPCDVLVFPRIDHTLLGTGIVKAIREFQAHAGKQAASILPARATMYAMGIQWRYPASDHALEPIDALRWSAYPQPLELGPDAWLPLTEAMRVAEIDLTDFSSATHDLELPVVADGRLNAIMFWFDIDLGEARISTAPGSDLACIKPAVQYTDPATLISGQTLPLRLHVMEHRLHFETTPAASLQRSHQLPAWYTPRLADCSSRDAYRNAITASLDTAAAQTVLNIGAGFGVTAMLAADAGANRVVACEANPVMARTAADIIARNQLQDRVTLVDKDCRQMTVPEDLAEKADLALFDLFDCSLIGEGILHFLAHARAHLLSDNARYLPMAAKLRGMIVEYRLDTLLGNDASLLNPYRFSPNFIKVDAATLPYRALTAPFDLFSFDFSDADPTPAEMAVTAPAIANGVAGAILFWFDLQLDAHTQLSNAPGTQPSPHWKQGLHFLSEVHVEAGMSLPVLARHNGSALRMQWQQDVLPAETFATFPRFDPRWLAATNELEQQTQSLLQHCSQNPEEHAKVAEIAKRFAVEPAAHGLDPVIAQRFVSIYFGL